MSEADSMIIVEREGGAAILRLHRPEQGNAISLALACELLAQVRVLAADPSVRCVVLTGTGRFFCVGGDIAAFGEAGDRVGTLMAQITDALHAAVAILATMDKPLVTAVNGPAAGAGLGLALLGDIVLAAASSHFTMAYTAIGLTPDGGTSWLLPRLIGLRRAQNMALTNKRVSSEEAERIGLITRSLPANADVLAEARSVAAELDRGATDAFASVRRLFANSTRSDFTDQLAEESQLICKAVRGPEGAAGIQAFLTKQRPVFSKT